MKKPNIDEWAQDCKTIGTQLRRYGYANNQLPDDAIRTEWNKTVSVISDFANKYGMPYEKAELLAGTIADSVNLGVAY